MIHGQPHIKITVFAYSVEGSLVICKPFLEFNTHFFITCEPNIARLHIFQYRHTVSALSEEDEKNDWNFTSV